MGNPSTIWAQLSMPNPPSGSVPFVLSDGVTIGTDVLNFSYNNSTLDLTVTNGVVPDSFPNTGLASPVTVNHLIGTVTIAIGTSATVVNCALLRAGAKVFLQRRTTDTTAVQLATTNVGVGTFTITSNANATAAFNVDFWVINTNIQSS